MGLVQFFVALTVMLAAVPDARAQDYPNKPVRMVVGFTPGGVSDTVARTVGPKLSAAWGRPVVIDNRPGAAGVVGANVVAKSTADGYTLFVQGMGFAVNAALHANLPYDPQRDCVAVAPLARQPAVLIVSASTGLKTVGELIAAAKAKPGQLNYGSGGVGSGAYFISEKFKLAAGIDVVHIPYKGAPEVIPDLIAGRITYRSDVIANALGHIREGRVVALGVSGARRSSLLPDVPTIADAGFPGFDITIWSGLWAPARTPAAVVEKISREVARALAAPDLRDQFTKLGAEPMTMTPAEFAKFVRREIEELKRIIMAAGIKPE